jgi:uncharacterized membrane protein YfcA
MALFIVGVVVVAVGGYLMYQKASSGPLSSSESEPDYSQSSTKIGAVLLVIGLLLAGIGLYDGGSGDGSCNADGVCSHTP